MDDLISRITRELPDTDRDRYDIAYERGRAQARSSLLAGGLALGAALGSAAMFLLDPERGAARRTALAERLGSLSGNAGGSLQDRATGLRERVTGKATELGLPGTGTAHDEPVVATTTETVAPAATTTADTTPAPVPAFEDTSTRAWRVSEEEFEPAGTGASQH